VWCVLRLLYCVFMVSNTAVRFFWLLYLYNVVRSESQTWRQRNCN